MQFVAVDPFFFRVLSVDDRPTSDGWVWLCGLQLNAQGGPVEYRRIYVMYAGLVLYVPRSNPAARRPIHQPSAVYAETGPVLWPREDQRRRRRV